MRPNPASRSFGQPGQPGQPGRADRTDPAGEAAPDRCALCGLNCGSASPEKEVGGRKLRFCCSGCLHVHDILSNLPDGPPRDFMDTDLYRQCLRAGLIARPEPVSGQAAAGGAPAGPDGARAGPADGQEQTLPLDPHIPPPALTRELHLQVGGMWCNACAWLVEEILSRTGGVLKAEVNFVSDLATVSYLPFEISPADICGVISRAGYTAAEFGADPGKTREEQNMLLRLGIAAILSLNTMMISFFIYYGFISTLEPTAVTCFSLSLLLLSSPVVFWCGRPIFARALAGLRQRSAGMDTLIALSALAAYGASLIGMAGRSLHLYFDTAAMLITLVLLGRFIEYHARRKIAAGLASFYQLARHKVRLAPTGDPRERWADRQAVPPGTCFAVRPGERVPLDGRIETGSALLDMSLLTGETRPVRRGSGQIVAAGCAVMQGSLTLRSLRPAAQSSLDRMIGLTREALGRKNRAELLADRVTRRIVPLVLLLAMAAAAVVLVRGGPAEQALLRAITVLLITCPCALGIAVPLAKVASLGVARRRGVLVRDAQALEELCRLDALVLDKTGTLTEGRFRLRRILPLSMSEDELLSRTAAVEQHCCHFLAHAVVEQARLRELSLPPASACAEIENRGAAGIVDGQRICVGNRALMRERRVDLPPPWLATARDYENDGDTVLFCAVGDRFGGLLICGDAIRPGIPELISRLRQKNITPWLVSGDSRRTTRAVARRLGIPDYVGQALPEEKTALLEELKGRGLRVGMMGDGINDAPALALADVGLALGAGSGLLQETSAITIMAPDPLKLIEVLYLAGLARRVVRQNLVFAFLYNACGIPLAAAGALNPLLAVLAMFASSLSVIGNSLRILRVSGHASASDSTNCRR